MTAIAQPQPGVALFLPTTHAGRSSRPLAKLVVVGPLLAMSSFLLLEYFAYVDVYHHHFFDHGWIVTYYNLCRVLYIAWLSWFIYYPGAALLAAIGGKQFLPSMPTADRYVAGFLTGAGLWHAVLFIIGLAGGYHRSVALVLVAIVVVASVPHLLYCLNETAAHLRARRSTLSDAPTPSLLTVFLLAISAAMFIAVKGLYPAGGHDYYTHYFYYYLSVIKHGSILPNEFWYHFYYSKGAGLYFFSMLLTDPLAPQLVTTAFIGCGALALFTLLRRAAPGSIVPWLGATLYLAFLIYTPGPDANRNQGGWGDLEKLHELSAVLALGTIWICSRSGFGVGRERWAWYVALALVIFAAVLITTFMAVMLSTFFGMLLLLGIFRRSRQQATMGLGGICLTSTFLLFVLTLNYSLTGIPSDQLLLQSWDWINLQKATRWGVLDDVLMLHYGQTGMVANQPALSRAILPLIFHCLRLDLWWPLALLGGIGALGWLFRRRANVQPELPRYAQVAWPLFLFVIGFCLICLVLGEARQQSISFYRMSSFTYGPVLCLVLLLCALLPRCGRWPELFLVLGLICALVDWPVLGMMCPPVRTTRGYRYLEARQGDLHAILANAKRFAQGRFSLRDAYQNQQGWPGRMPWGGIYPAMEKVREVVGPGTPIWTLHTHSYCMLPDADLRTIVAARSPFSVLLFGTPAEGRRSLEEEGINYFFVSKELQLSSYLPVTPLFAPDTISEHLGVRWTDGTSYLLTWTGPETHPLDAAFLDRYAEQVRECPAVQSFPLQDMRRVYAYLQEHGLKPFRLPWYHRGWKD